MCGITLICVGKLKEKFFSDAFAEYQKRLGAFCRFDLIEIPEQRLSDDPTAKEIAAALDREASEIEKHIPASAALIALCVEGKQMSSPAFAAQLKSRMDAGKSRFCFLVGGSCGLSEKLKAKAELRLSVSEMTFPHHLFRVMLSEQIYRAFSILEGGRYHK